MLSNFQINEAKRILNEIIDSTEVLRNFNSLKTIIENDANFSVFVNGTKLGIDLYEELYDLIKIVNNDVCNKLESLNNYTYNYLNNRYSIDEKK